MAGLQCYWARIHDMPAMIQYLDHWATAALVKAVESHALSGCKRLVEGRLETPDHPQSVISQNWRRIDLNRTVNCMVLIATAGLHQDPCRDKFRRPGDEAHFWLNGYVNKQNCRIWSEATPQVYVETPLHPEKLTVWCALWAGGILLQKR
ncbi:hypothetical protein TNCV_347141 [Trichonephila clavipes]|nr:hypothetical protein TNCV_347141 [Trichonephila clavipes]